ncbi:MAG: creatininase family protein, partial [Paracoccaceae bacterium]|nr:creatininase family protein [Paracoccaceae bacterium]
MPNITAFASELTWPDYAALIQTGHTPILIPIGSMEQHGHHMPLHVDVLLPTEFARRAAL